MWGHLDHDPHPPPRWPFSYAPQPKAVSPGCLKLVLCLVVIAAFSGLLPIAFGVICLAVIIILSSQGKW